MVTQEWDRSQAHSKNYWPWSPLVWLSLIVIVVGTLVVLGSYGWRSGNNYGQPRQYIQGEQPLQAAPQAGDPGGLAPANEQHDPLAR